MRIAITGSGGWLARCAFSAISNLNSEGFNIEAQMFSSRAQEIHLRSGLKYNTKLLSESSNLDFDLIVPLSFLTQEKFNILGETAYRAQNFEVISAELVAFAERNNSRVLLISSGVVNNPSDLQVSKPSYSCYADMKKLQEKMYENKFGVSKLSVCYLYSCTSNEIPNWQNYAFSTVVHDAFFGNRIIIKNNLPVFRKFVDATELFYVMLKEIIAGNNFHISSGGPLIEIEELAKKANEIFSNKSEILREKSETNMYQDNYYAIDNSMERLFEIHNKKMSTIEDQILNVSRIFIN